MGFAEEHDIPAVPATPEPLHNMAATPEPPAIIDATPELPAIRVASSEPSAIVDVMPKSSAVTDVVNVALEDTQAFQGHLRVVSSVEDTPLMSVKAAGTPVVSTLQSPVALEVPLPIMVVAI